MSALILFTLVCQGPAAGGKRFIFFIFPNPYFVSFFMTICNRSSFIIKFQANCAYQKQFITQQSGS